MGIEAQVASVAKPFEGARVAFDGILADVSSKSALSLSHSELEAMLHDRGLELMRQVLQGHIDLRGPGQALSLVQTVAGLVLTHERWDRGRHWESIFGTISLQRVGYGAKEEAMAYPLDGDLNLPKERYLLGVRRRVGKEVVRGSFDAAVEAVGETTGAHVPKRQDLTGARWRLQRAEAVLRLRSIYASGDFDDYWRFHEKQEHLQNHASRYAGGVPEVSKGSAAPSSGHKLALVG